jgi:hypothetical protein
MLLRDMEQRTSDNLDLGNTVGVTEDNTDLRRGGTLTGKLADLVDDLLGGGLEPCRRSARVGDGAGSDTLSLGMKTAHFECRCEGEVVGLEGRRMLVRQFEFSKQERAMEILSLLPIVNAKTARGGHFPMFHRTRTKFVSSFLAHT